MSCPYEGLRSTIVKRPNIGDVVFRVHSDGICHGILIVDCRPIGGTLIGRIVTNIGVGVGQVAKDQDYWIPWPTNSSFHHHSNHERIIG